MELRYSKERCNAPNNAWLANKNTNGVDVLVLVGLEVNNAKPHLVRDTAWTLPYLSLCRQHNAHNISVGEGRE